MTQLNMHPTFPGSKSHLPVYAGKMGTCNAIKKLRNLVTNAIHTNKKGRMRGDVIVSQ